MNISVAQISPVRGNIAANIEKHVRCIEAAESLHASSIFFPELSLTAYEPTLAGELAIYAYDNRLSVFQGLSDKYEMTIGLGVPLKSERGVCISMIIFQPHVQHQAYAKQQLHPDEFPYFVKGDQQVIFTVDGKKVAPGICYESLQTEHSAYAVSLGAELYLACVAKAARGVDKAMVHYPETASRYSIPVLMSNSVGPCDDFISAGGSAAWTKNGHLAGQLNDRDEGILLFDTQTESARIYSIL